VKQRGHDERLVGRLLRQLSLNALTLRSYVVLAPSFDFAGSRFDRAVIGLLEYGWNVSEGG